MEPILLRYFREVAEQGSVRQAAERLFVAQSAVSRQVAMLEEELGVTLFERRARGMVLTDAGRLLLDYSHDMRFRFEELRATIREYQILARGHVELTTVEGLVDNFLPDVISEFLTDFPGVSLEVTTLGSHAVEETVAQRCCDLGIMFGDAPGPELLALGRMRQPLCLLVAAGHPLAGLAECTLEDVASFPLILPQRMFGIRQLIDRASAQRKLRLEVAVETNTLAFAKQLVMKSPCHVTFLPADFASVDIRAGTAVSVPVREPVLVSTHATLITSAACKLSPAANHLADRLAARMEQQADTAAQVGAGADCCPVPRIEERSHN